MTTHILIELDHPPFEVTRESIESLPDWLKNDGYISCPRAEDFCRLSTFDGDHHPPFGHYLVAHSGTIDVRKPEWVAKYLKQNPYEECAKVADKAIKDSALKDELSPGDCAALAFNAIRQLEQKEIGK